MYAETGREITYKEIIDRSVKLALWMKEEEVYPGDLVAICTSHHVGFYAFLACLYVGAVPMMRKYKHCADYGGYNFFCIYIYLFFLTIVA